MDVEDGLDWLAEALAGLEVPVWTPPESLEDVEALQAAVAPMRLPEELLAFWRRVDIATLRLEPYPAFCAPEFALSFWEQSAPEVHPLPLVLVGYSSHDCMSIELEVDELPGGALFEWFLSDLRGFERRFNSLGEWLGYILELLARGSYTRWDSPRGPWVRVPAIEDWEREHAWRTPPPDHPVHGNVLHVDHEIRGWPGHWQRANGLTAEAERLRGASHTIADAVAGPNEGRRATIAGRVVSLDRSMWGPQVRVQDGTGTIDVFCPAPTTLRGPRRNEWFEFDIHLLGNRAESAPGSWFEKLAAKQAGAPQAVAVAMAVRPMPALKE